MELLLLSKTLFVIISGGIYDVGSGEVNDFKEGGATITIAKLCRDHTILYR